MSAEGIDTTSMREETELLAAELGRPLPPDTPYPNVIRWLAIFDLEMERRRPAG